MEQKGPRRDLDVIGAGRQSNNRSANGQDIRRSANQTGRQSGYRYENQSGRQSGGRTGNQTGRQDNGRTGNNARRQVQQGYQRTPRVLTEEEKRARARARHNAMLREKRAKARRARITLAAMVVVMGILIGVLIFVNLGERDGQSAEANHVQQAGTPADTQAPTVSASDIEIETGGSLSYRNAIKYSDNVDSLEDMTLVVDNTQVDTNKAGVYTATYTVTDRAGNVASGQLTVTVKDPISPQEQEVYDMADAVLDEILTDDMDMKQKARTIYDWIRSNVHYINHSEKDSWVQGAYEGLANGQGDCFVFAATAKVLLTRAEIPNLDIVKATINPSHYWNLVDVGDGWYHYDTTPRKDGSEFFLWTDEELEAYSKEHDNCHNFDRSLYPEIN